MPTLAFYDVASPAKLNLFLHVIGQRKDGYHLLQSVFVLIDWLDTLHFELRQDGQLVRHDLTASLPADDLCLRAAKALQVESGTHLGVDISIDKQIPWGAGMGGGSSNAATVLLALNQLWQLHWDRPRLLQLGLKLGADVPFFLGGRNAWVEGVGDQLTPLDLPRQWYAVIKPVQPIETRAIFMSPLLVRNTEAATLAGFLARDGISGLLQGFGRNDLQPVAEANCGEVVQASRLLHAHFGNSRMTGSGSAVFARAGERNNALAAVKAPRTNAQSMAALQKDLPSGWIGRMCSSLATHPLLDWAED